MNDGATNGATDRVGGFDGMSAGAVSVACDIANHIAAVPMLRERLQVLTAALEASNRDNDRLRAENERLRAGNKRALAIASRVTR